MGGLTGDFDVHASNGSVDIARATGTFDIETSNGRIDFAAVIVPGVDNRMTTSNGSAEITSHGTPSVKLDASTTNGSIKARSPILTTFSGDKHHIVGTIGAGDAELFVKTANGSVTVQRDTLMKSLATDSVHIAVHEGHRLCEQQLPLQRFCDPTTASRTPLRSPLQRAGKLRHRQLEYLRT